jgi:hypothetical protein
VSPILTVDLQVIPLEEVREIACVSSAALPAFVVTAKIGITSPDDQGRTGVHGGMTGPLPERLRSFDPRGQFKDITGEYR